jgi:ATP-dependent DNA ligase
MTTLEKLYAFSKNGKILFFDCSYQLMTTEIASYGAIYTSTGYLNGKPKNECTKVTKGKNLGKSNETTILQQTEIEAKAKHAHKLKEGYKTLSFFKLKYNIGSVEELEKLPSYQKINMQEDGRHYKPMLAEKFTAKTVLPDGFYLQPKLNGVRCNVSSLDYQQISREGSTYNLDHIKDQLKSIFGNNIPMIGIDVVLDGELYVHGKKLQDILSLVVNPTIESTLVDYCIYDVYFPQQPYASFGERWKWLKEHIGEGTQNIKLVETIEESYRTPDEVYAYCDQKIKEGYEGCMVRHIRPYEPGFRSDYLLKVKRTQSKEYEIIGVNLKDKSKPEDFVWVCIVPENKVKFEVKPHGTEASRADMYQNFGKYIGKKLQLSFHELTKDKIPFHITEVIVRDYE